MPILFFAYFVIVDHIHSMNTVTILAVAICAGFAYFLSILQKESVSC